MVYVYIYAHKSCWKSYTINTLKFKIVDAESCNKLRRNK